MAQGKPKPKAPTAYESWKKQQEQIKRDMAKRASREPVPQSARKPMSAARPVKPSGKIAGQIRKGGK